jgi:hypothetical protein
MGPTWCRFCFSQHEGDLNCPGVLDATGTERHGWRVTVETPHGIEAYGVLIAECGSRFRARILTYPNILWLAPGLQGTLKFVGASPSQVEAKAVEFIKAHCRQRGFRICDEPILAWNDPFMAVQADNSVQRNKRPQVIRKIVFTPIRYGPFRPEYRAGTGNVSETGLFIITNSPPLVGSHVRMRLELENYGIPLYGEICWARTEPEEGRVPGAGVRLSMPPVVYRRYVMSLP